MGNRYDISEEIKKELWDSQNGQCARCGSNENLELDHIKRVCDGGGGQIENLQYLCSKCHSDKTEEESDMRDVPINTYWESSMAGDVLQVVMEGFKPQNLIHGDGQENCLALDGVRSRYNG